MGARHSYGARETAVVADFEKNVLLSTIPYSLFILRPVNTHYEKS